MVLGIYSVVVEIMLSQGGLYSFSLHPLGFQWIFVTLLNALSLKGQCEKKYKIQLRKRLVSELPKLKINAAQSTWQKNLITNIHGTQA